MRRNKNGKIDISSLRTWEEIDAELMKNPKYVEAWEKIEPEYELERQLIRARLKKKMSQNQVAKKVGTGQAVISRLESGNAKPSISLLQRVARALDTEIRLVIR